MDILAQALIGRERHALEEERNREKNCARKQSARRRDLTLRRNSVLRSAVRDDEVLLAGYVDIVRVAVRVPELVVLEAAHREE